MDVLTEAMNLFLDFKEHYEELFRHHPARSKIRWYHKLLGVRPRGEFYKDAVSACERALQELDDGNVGEVIHQLDKFIRWYECEWEVFRDSVSEIRTNLEIKETIHSMYLLRKNLVALISEQEKNSCLG